MNEQMYSQRNMARTNQQYERHWSDQYSANNTSLESMQTSYNYGMYANPNLQAHWSDVHSQSSYMHAENLPPVNYGGPNIVHQPHWSDLGPRRSIIQENKNIVSNSRTPHPQMNKANQLPQTLVLGDSWVQHLYDHKNIANENGIQFDSQWWPSANVETIMQNLENYIKPHHKNLLIFCLISETWRYETLENIPDKDNDSQYKILMPNPEFSILNFVEKFTELRSFCKHLNSNLKVFLMTPPRVDAYQFNLELISRYPQSYQDIFLSNSKYEAPQIAEASKEIYGKIIEMCSTNHGWPEKSIFRNQIIAQKVKPCQKLFTKFMKSKIDTCGKEGPFVDGINPTVDFIKVFWDQVKSWLDIDEGYGVSKSIREYQTEEDNYLYAQQNSKPVNYERNTLESNPFQEVSKEDVDYRNEYGEDFNLDSGNSDNPTGFFPGIQPLSQAAPINDGPMDSNRLEILMVGDYSVNGLGFAVQPGMPRVTVNYIPYGKLDQLIDLADSYLDEKYDVLVLVPFNWEFLNLTCLMPDDKAPKVPQINANISFDKIIQMVKDATFKWTDQFRHLKVIWGLPYPIDFCKYYSYVVTEYGSTWNPTPEINNAILYITKKFYSYILILEEYVHKVKPPINFLDLRNCFFLKESILECSFRQGDVPKFPPFCLKENGIDPSETLCQRFKYALLDKMQVLEVKPSLAYRRRRSRMQKQKKLLLQMQSDNVQDVDDRLNKDLEANVDESLKHSQESSNMPHQNMSDHAQQQQINLQQAGIMPIMSSVENIQPSVIQHQSQLNQANLMHQETPPHHLPLRSQGSWEQPFEQPMNMQRQKFPVQRTDILPQSMVNILRADIPPPPPPPLPSTVINVQPTNIPPLSVERPQIISQPLSQHQSATSQSIGPRLSDACQSRNMQQDNLYQPAYQQQHQMQQFNVLQPTYPPYHETTNQPLMQQEYTITHGNSIPHQAQLQAHHHQEPLQQFGTSQPMYTQKQCKPDLVRPIMDPGIVSTLPNQNLYPSKSSEMHQKNTSSSSDLLITGSMLDTLKEALNYLKSSKPEDTGKGNNPMVTTVEPVLVEPEKEDHYDNSPFRILDIKESSYSYKLSLFFQQSRWKDLFLKGTKAVAMDTLFSAVKAMIMLKPGRGVKIILITTSESFINECEKSLSPIVETSLIGVNNDIPFGTPIALIDSPTNLRLRLAQSRFRDASELSALIVFGDDLIYNVQSPASIELMHLIKLIYNKAPAEYVNKVVISEAGSEEYEDVASHILGTKFSTKREKKRSQPKDDGLSLFEMLAEELEKEEAEELAKKEAAKKTELEVLQQKIAEEEAKQKELRLKLGGISPVSSNHSLPASPVSDTSFPEMDDEAAFAKFLESLGPVVEKEYMEMGKKILLDHEKQYQNFIEVPVYHPDYRVKKDTFTSAYKKKFGISYKQEPFDKAWSTYWKNYIAEVKEEEWSKKMIKLQEKFRSKYENSSKKDGTKLIHDESPQKEILIPQSDTDSAINKKAIADMVDAMLGKKNVKGSFNDKVSSNTERAAGENVTVEKESSCEITDNLMTITENEKGISTNLVSDDHKSEAIVKKTDINTEKLNGNVKNKVTEEVKIANSECSENLFPSGNVEKTSSKEKINIVSKKNASGSQTQIETNIDSTAKMLSKNEITIYGNQDKAKIDVEKKVKDKEDREPENTEQKGENSEETGPKNLKAKMKEFEKKKYAEIAKDEDFVSLIFDAKDSSEKVTEPLFVEKKSPPILDMFQLEDKVIQDKKCSTSASKLCSIQQQLNQLKSDKKIPGIVPMKFIPGTLSKKSGKVGDIPGKSSAVTPIVLSPTVNSASIKNDKVPLFKPAAFVEVPPVATLQKVLKNDPCINKSLESKVSFATLKSSTSTFSHKTVGAVAELLRPSDEKTVSNVGTDDCIEELMKSIGSGRHFKGANEPKTSSISQIIQSRERSRSPIRQISKDESKAEEHLSLYLKEKEKLSKGQNISKTSNVQNHLALYLNEREKGSVDKSVSKNQSSKETLELYLKEKQFLDKGKLDASKSLRSNDSFKLNFKAKEKDSIEKSSSAALDLYLKEKHSKDVLGSAKTKNVLPSHMASLDLYLKEKISAASINSAKTKSVLPEPKTALDLYLKEKQLKTPIDTLSTDKGKNILSEHKPALDLYLKEKRSIDSLNVVKEKNVLPVPNTALDLYLKEKRFIDSLNTAKGKNVLPEPKTALDLYLKEKVSSQTGNDDKDNVRTGSKAILDLYLKEKQSIKKDNNSSNSKDALDLYLKEKQSIKKDNNSSSSKDALELYLKEKQSMEKGSIVGSGSKAPLSLYLKEKQASDNGNREKSNKSASSNEVLELYLKEKAALNKKKEDVGPGVGLSSGNPLDLYLQEKSKLAIAKGKQDKTSNSKGQLELYLKEKMSGSKDKRTLQDLHGENSLSKRIKLESYNDVRNPLKNQQDIVILDNTLSLLESVCGVMGMMGHALKAIISKAKGSFPDYNKALKVFAEDDSVTLVNYAIKKMTTLSNGSETHKYRSIINLASKLLEEAKSTPSTLVNVSSETSKVSGNYPVDVTSIAKATIGKDSAQTYQFIKTTFLYKGLPEPSANELEEVFKAVSKLQFTLTFKS